MLCTCYQDVICVYIFSIYVVLPLPFIFIWFIFSLYCSSSGFEMLSQSAYGINETLKWYWPSLNFNYFYFSQGILTLTWPLMLHYLSCLSLSEESKWIHAKLTCSFICYMCYIQSLKQPWKVIDCCVMSVFTIRYHE